MIKIGEKIMQLRKAKGWSQTDLAKAVNASREAIGKYERNEAVPAVDTAKKIADAFEVSLDYLVGEGLNASFDKKNIQRLQEIENMEPEEKNHVLFTLDALIKSVKLKSIGAL